MIHTDGRFDRGTYQAPSCWYMVVWVPWVASDLSLTLYEQGNLGEEGPKHNPPNQPKSPFPEDLNTHQPGSRPTVNHLRPTLVSYVRGARWLTI